jgi:hypothetical protein
MTDSDKDAPAESASQRALRMKKLALESRRATPGRDASARKAVAGVGAGVSKPWLKK